MAVTDLSALQAALNRRAALQRAVLEEAAKRRAAMNQQLIAKGQAGATAGANGSAILSPAQTAVPLTETERRTLALTVLGEAAGEGKKGQEAVAWVIRNRAESGKYPANPAQVALQHDKKGRYQFSTWADEKLGGNDPATRFKPGSQEYNEALDIIDRVFTGQSIDPTNGAIYYYANLGANAIDEPHWFNSAVVQRTQIGNHLFGGDKTRAELLGQAPQPFAQPAAIAAGRGLPVQTGSKLANGALPRINPVAELPASADVLANVVRNPAIFAALPVAGQAAAQARESSARDNRPLVPNGGGILVPAVNRSGSPDERSSRPPPERETHDEKNTPAPNATVLAGAALAAGSLPQAPKEGLKNVSGSPDDRDRTSQPSSGVQRVETVYVDPSGRTATVDQITGFKPVPPGARPNVPTIVNPTLQAAVSIAQPATKIITKTVMVKNPNYKAPAMNVSGSPDDRDARNAALLASGAAGQTPGIAGSATLTPLPQPVLPVEPEFIPKQVKVVVPVSPAPLPPVGGSPGVAKSVLQSVMLASGRSVPVGTTGTAQGGRYNYAVQPDGSILNLTTGRTSAPAPGAPSAIPGFDRESGTWYEDKGGGRTGGSLAGF